MHNSFIVSISFQQIVAKTKKSWVRHTIVFENNRFFHLFKKPLKPTGRAARASQIIVGIVSYELTLPIDAINNCPGRETLFDVPEATRSRTIGDYQ
jgi:hypothetical protein